MPHMHICLQELDHLYHAGDFDLYEQSWQKACQQAEHFFQVLPLPPQNSTAQVMKEYLMVPSIIS